MAEEGTVTAPDGVRLHYVKVGAGRRWLLVPGVGNEADFGPLARRHTVVFFDLRNRGGRRRAEPGERSSYQVEVDDVDTVRRHFGLDQVDLFGWSYVGLVVARCTDRRPAQVERLVLACPVPLREGPPRRSRPPTAGPRHSSPSCRRAGSSRTDPVAFAPGLAPDHGAGPDGATRPRTSRSGATRATRPTGSPAVWRPRSPGSGPRCRPTPTTVPRSPRSRRRPCSWPGNSDRLCPPAAAEA